MWVYAYIMGNSQRMYCSSHWHRLQSNVLPNLFFEPLLLFNCWFWLQECWNYSRLMKHVLQSFWFKFPLPIWVAAVCGPGCIVRWYPLRPQKKVLVYICRQTRTRRHLVLVWYSTMYYTSSTTTVHAFPTKIRAVFLYTRSTRKGLVVWTDVDDGWRPIVFLGCACWASESFPVTMILCSWMLTTHLFCSSTVVAAGQALDRMILVESTLCLCALCVRIWYSKLREIVDDVLGSKVISNIASWFNHGKPCLGRRLLSATTRRQRNAPLNSGSPCFRLWLQFVLTCRCYCAGEPFLYHVSIIWPCYRSAHQAIVPCSMWTTRDIMQYLDILAIQSSRSEAMSVVIELFLEK